MAGWIHDEHQRTYLAVRQALGESSRKAASDAGSKVSILDDLWAHRDADDATLEPYSVSSRVFRTASSRTPDKIESSNRIRQPIAMLRSSLKMYFDTDAARRLSFTMSIADGAYRLVFEPRQVQLKRFWAPMVRSESASVVATAPLFMRHRGKRLFLRHLDVNDEKRLELLLRSTEVPGGLKRHPSRLLGRFGSPEVVELLRQQARDLEPRRPYTTVGEMTATLALHECFRELGVAVSTSFAHEHRQRPPNSLVMLGNVRTNALMRAIPKNALSAIQGKKSIIVRGVRRRNDDVLGPGGTVYGLITRIAGPASSGPPLVALSANHAALIGAIAGHVTSESKMTALLADTGQGSEGELPPLLQILVVAALDDDDAVDSPQFETVSP